MRGELGVIYWNFVTSAGDPGKKEGKELTVRGGGRVYGPLDRLAGLGRDRAEVVDLRGFEEREGGIEREREAGSFCHARRKSCRSIKVKSRS